MENLKVLTPDEPMTASEVRKRMGDWEKIAEKELRHAIVSPLIRRMDNTLKRRNRRLTLEDRWFKVLEALIYYVFPVIGIALVFLMLVQTFL